LDLPGKTVLAGPLSTASTVSKVLPMVSMTSTPSARGRSPNHFEAPPITPQWLGSSAEVVAVRLSVALT
jgi:hypothetical protein